MTKNNMAEDEKIFVLKIFPKNVLELILKDFIILFGAALKQLLSD